jgi:putative tryptophan/tyrosine transport system substrate-binding protein
VRRVSRRSKGLALLLALAACAGSSGAQNASRIGILSGAAQGIDFCTDAVRRGLATRGYVEGRTIDIELRRSEGGVESFPALARDLVRSKVDVLVVTSLAAEAAKQATMTIPIVMSSSSYPVERGLIASLGRPGANITGQATHTGDLMQKRIQILREAVPSISHIAILRLAGPVQDLFVKDLNMAAKQFGIRTHVAEVRRAEDLQGVFEAATRAGADAFIVTQGPFFTVHRQRIADLALRHRLPALSGEIGAAEAGALLFYGPDIVDGCGRAAGHVDRILRGAKPGELPVEQPTKFELVVNLRTAKALGIVLPGSVLARADRVVQ